MNSPTPEQLGPGFLIEMRDGSRYFIRPEKWIQWYVDDTMLLKKNIDRERDHGEPLLTKKIAREWADNHLSGKWDMCHDDFIDFFEGTVWSDFADIAIRLPDKPRLSPDELWDDTADIEFVKSITPSS